MKEINIENLGQGSVAEADYYGPDGKVLIKSGASVTASLLSALSRRQVQKLFVQEEGEDIKKLLKLKELELHPLDEFLEELPSGPPPLPEKVVPVLAGLQPGEKGVQAILNSPQVKALDQAIESQRITFAVTPSGTPLSREAKTIGFGERTRDYKNEISDYYDDSIKVVKRIFNLLRCGEMDQGKTILRVVNGFVNTFLNDRHMLLNLANVKSKESDYLYAHSANTCLLAISIAASQGHGRAEIVEIGVSALLHDVGALFIPEQIRFKSESLTEDERYEIQKHPMVGIHLVEKIRGLPPSTPLVCYQSHERENKKGYPKNRGGRLIHDFAKTVSVADLYESLTAGRPYRAPVVPYKAMESLLIMVKEGFFNSSVVKFFLEYTSLFPVGSLVKLNTGETAKVVGTNREHYSRPVVTVIISTDQKLLTEDNVRKLDLLAESEIKITQPLDNARLNIDVMRGF